MQSSNNNRIRYQKPLSSYCTPLCAPFEQKIFENEQQPTSDIHRNMCRLNNACKDDSAYTYLNERGVPESPFFKQEKGQVMPKVFVSTKADARLMDSSRDYEMELDIPPTMVFYNLINDNVYQNPELNGYGKDYKSYSSKQVGGQIQYYIDKELSIPFPRSVYGATSQAVGYSFKDPMDSVKMQFEKSYPMDSCSGLSFLDDSTHQRDDIIALQRRKFNEQRYDLVHGRI